MLIDDRIDLRKYIFIEKIIFYKILNIVFSKLYYVENFDKNRSVGITKNKKIKFLPTTFITFI